MSNKAQFHKRKHRKFKRCIWYDMVRNKERKNNNMAKLTITQNKRNIKKN